MTNSTAKVYYGNHLIQYLFPCTCLGILILAGLVIHSFIVAVNLIDWMKRRSITGADKIITAIGITRIFFQIACLLYFLELYFSKFPNIYFILIGYTLNSLSRSNVCLSTLLAIFLYFKISTFHTVFFLRLKAIMSKRVIYLIVTSVLFSLGYTSLSMLVTQSICFQNSTQDCISDYKQKHDIIRYFNLLCDISIFVMVFIMSSLLIILLGIHMSRMNNPRNVTSSTNVYSRTVTFTVVSILIWAVCLTTIITDEYMRFLDPIWFFIIVNIFATLHSVLLIYVATKLRIPFFRIVHCGTDCLFKRNAPGPPSTETVEETPL